MSMKYSCIAKLQNDGQAWNFDGTSEDCIQELNKLGLAWEFIHLFNANTKEHLAVLFPLDETIFE